MVQQREQRFGVQYGDYESSEEEEDGDEDGKAHFHELFYQFFNH